MPNELDAATYLSVLRLSPPHYLSVLQLCSSTLGDVIVQSVCPDWDVSLKRHPSGASGLTNVSSKAVLLHLALFTLLSRPQRLVFNIVSTSIHLRQLQYPSCLACRTTPQSNLLEHANSRKQTPAFATSMTDFLLIYFDLD